MNDDLDQNLADSLHRRAHEAPTDGQHFGDVRRRVRRRRQRHMAMGVAPALIGVGYLATRPIAEPTQSAASATTQLDVPEPTMLMTPTTNYSAELPFRCLETSAYESTDGWTYFLTCEQLPPMTVPGDPTAAVNTGPSLDPYTVFAPTTSDSGQPIPEQTSTTSTELASTTTSTELP